jgi:2-C-methyl-D-erythritol 4-phosphate cytidylyltransferase
MNVALLLSGGTGTRVGGEIPKQYMEVQGKPMIAYCLFTILTHKAIDAVRIVAAPAWHTYILQCLKQLDLPEDIGQKFQGFSLPGENRQLSIWNGLQDIRACSQPDANVLIHDAARPLLSGDLITACLEALGEYDGVLPVLPMKDTVYMSEDGEQISALLERNRIFAGQAPEVFRLEAYYQANQDLLPDQILQINGSTEPAVLAGMKIRMIPGDERNFKVTTAEDLEKFKNFAKIFTMEI